MCTATTRSHDPSLLPERSRPRRVLVRATGQVQAVGFRPFVARLAAELRLVGHVGNDLHGAFIEVQGPSDTIDQFLDALPAQLPPLAKLDHLHITAIPPIHDEHFRIVDSAHDGTATTLVPPDAATCPDCLREMLDPSDRRYRYPFINCTNCGPRYSIIHALPYDRPETTMAGFPLCELCRAEYDSPTDRRFHAQPNACPTCGPSLQLVDSDGAPLSGWTDPIAQTVKLIQDGAIVAIKGIGGFHLVCSAENESVVQRLRARKGRESKPLALMVADLDQARLVAFVDEVASAAISTVARPIVLLPRRPGARVARSVAPGVDTLGVMLPYAPLHTLLFAEGLGPLVMTSGNDSGDPLCFDNDDALDRLAPLADALLLNNRPIARPIDDSVLMWAPGTDGHAATVHPVRRARGLVPQTIALPAATSRPGYGTDAVIALGGDLKSTVCVTRGSDAIVSEHLGDLQSVRAYRNFSGAVGRLLQLTQVTPAAVACDMHPGYHSRRLTKRFVRSGCELIEVQHHHAHVVSCMVDRGLSGQVVGLACDGTGYGPDGTIWGGEVLVADETSYERHGWLQTFTLVGGDEAARQTWRAGIGLLACAYGDRWRETWKQLDLPVPAAFGVVSDALDLGRGVDTSSVGRLFDGVASLLGVCGCNHYEAEGAIRLETLATRCAGREQVDVDDLPVHVRDRDGLSELQTGTLVDALVKRRLAGESPDVLSLAFHRAVAEGLSQLALRAARDSGLERVVLSGGVFHNTLLRQIISARLSQAGLRVYAHQTVPCGDGGLSLGQAAVALARRAAGVGPKKQGAIMNQKGDM